MDVRVCVAVAVVEVVEWSREEGWWGIGVGILETVVAGFDGETRARRVDGRVYMEAMDRYLAGLS